jgi:uncharacterized protein with GYD domain
VPERDPIAFAQLPAQVDLAAAALRAEIDEADVRILYLDTELGDVAEERLDLARDGIGRPAPIRGHAPLEVFEKRSHGRQEGLGLSARERRHMLTPEYPPGRVLMATYVLLTKVSAAGVKTIQSNPRRIKEVNKEIEALGARVVAQYATLGRYDFVNIVEAKDAEAIARISVALGARGTVAIETLTAIPIETFVRAVGRKGKT